MSPSPVPTERRSRRPVPEPSADYLNPHKLFGSLLAGWGVAASLSSAAVLQHVYPRLRIADFPIAAAIGLLLGWALAVPVARHISRKVDAQRLGWVVLVAIALGIVFAIPAACFAPAIGWTGGSVRLFVAIGMFCGSGLILGGYLDCDRAAVES